MQVVREDIAQDRGDYERLRDLMQELHQSLLVRDSDRIAQLNAQISELVQRGRLRAERRSKILAAFRLAPGPEGMSRLLAGYPAAQRQQVRHDWDRLGELVSECHELNERNGALLAMQQEILGQLLGDSQSTAHVYQPQSPY